MAGGAQDDNFFLTISHGGLLGYTPPPLDFHGAGGRGHRPWLCKHAPLSRTGVEGPQAEERAIAADGHRIARVPCDKFLFYVFLAEALKKITVCPVVKKRSRQIATCMFLFKQSYMRRCAP